MARIRITIKNPSSLNDSEEESISGIAVIVNVETGEPEEVHIDDKIIFIDANLRNIGFHVDSVFDCNLVKYIGPSPLKLDPNIKFPPNPRDLPPRDKVEREYTTYRLSKEEVSENQSGDVNIALEKYYVGTDLEVVYYN